MTAPVKMKIWDVEHGVCIYIETPNKKRALLDGGSSSNFSPAIYLHEDLKIKKLDYLLISHPHDDHIRDIENIDYYFDIKVLGRNKKIDKEVMKEDNSKLFTPPNDKRITKYFEIDKKFTEPVKDEEKPSDPRWGIGCSIKYFKNDDKSLSVNDLSLATFVNFGHERILYGGDLEEKGWLELLKNENFKEYLAKTTILIASHHGRDSGFCSEIFKYFTPKLTVVSAGKYTDSDATSRYDEVTTGMKIKSMKRGEEKRKVVTTRKDGHINITIYSDFNTTEILVP